MKLFSTLFNFVKLPVVIVQDVACIVPDLVDGDKLFTRTEEQCKEIDEAIG